MDPIIAGGITAGGAFLTDHLARIREGKPSLLAEKIEAERTANRQRRAYEARLGELNREWEALMRSWMELTEQSIIERDETRRAELREQSAAAKAEWRRVGEIANQVVDAGPGAF